MATINKYRIRCITDSVNECVLGTAAPTACPTNGSHTVDTSTVVIVKGNVQVNEGTPKSLALADYKQLRYNEIDANTGILIAAGFAYDSKTFSLSMAAQTNWNTLKDNESEFTWPVDVSTVDNDTYSLTAVNLAAFWTAARDATKGHLDTGRVLKKSVIDAADEAAVDAVVDSR